MPQCNLIQVASIVVTLRLETLFLNKFKVDKIEWIQNCLHKADSVRR